MENDETSGKWLENEKRLERWGIFIDNYTPDLFLGLWTISVWR